MISLQASANLGYNLIKDVLLSRYLLEGAEGFFQEPLLIPPSRFVDGSGTA